MADFTMALKEVIESLYGTSMDADDYEQKYSSVEFGDIKYGELPVLDDYKPLGLGTYPIFDEGYRQILNGKIIDEYWNREIGTETIDNFRLILRKKMDQIMPYYNQMYESQQIEYSALQTMDIRSIGKSDLKGKEDAETKNNTTTETKSGSRGINSNFPQTMLAGDEDYATSGNDLNSTSKVEGDGELTVSSNNSSENNSDSHVTGYQGNAASLVMQYRNSLINVDTMVLAELEDCFMLLFNNGDEYFAREHRIGW